MLSDDDENLDGNLAFEGFMDVLSDLGSDLNDDGFVEEQLELPFLSE